RPPGVDEDRSQRDRCRVEAGLALRPRRRPERAVEVVRPRVVGALQRRTTTRLLDDLRPAMTADVEKGAERPGAVADDDHGGCAGEAREAVTRLGQPFER